MFFYPEFDENNEKILCRQGGFNAEMLMDITVKRMQKGDALTIIDEVNETAVFLVEGVVTFQWDGRKESGDRANPFEKKPYALHVSRNTEITVVCDADNTEIIVMQTENKREFPPVFYNPDNCLYQEFGKGQWGGAGHRIVSTVFDYDNAPYSNMVLGEVYTQPGKWSSYPPHHHPQPEVYYYRFDKPQGFGACFNGNEAYKSTDGSYCAIKGGDSHQQASAPGYEMYYVWMVRHLPDDPWYKTTRIVDDEHQWLVNG